jgi:RNA polymerase-binding protein DksA
VPFGISATATSKNADLLLTDEFYDFYFKEQGASYMWQFQIMPIGRGKDELELMVSPEKRLQLFRKWEKLLAEGFGKSLPEDLVRSFDIGDEGDRADNESTNEVTILISARDKEKLHAIEGALEKIREGTYGVCEECGDEIGGGRQKVMPLAQLCVTCQSKIEKETEHQKFAREEMGQEELIREVPEE